MTAVVLLAFVYQVASVYGLGAALITSATVRLAIGAGFAAVTIKYVYLALATAVLATLAAGMEPDRRRRRRHLGLFGASAASIYFSTGRGTLLLILIVGATTYFSVVGLRVSRLLALGAGAMTLAVVTIVVLGTLVGKTFTNSPLVNVQSSFTARPQVSALALPYEYLSAPVAFVGQEVSRATTTGTTHGCATLAPACAVLKAVGLDVHPETLIRPFTPPPIVWNTYTALDLPLLDGGFVFALPIVFLLGLGTGVAWGHARRRYLWGIVVYGVLSSAVVFSIGQNNFFAPHIAAAIAIALLTLETAKAWQFAARSRGWGDDMGGGRAAVNRSP